MKVKSMGPISESELTYSMDCFFRQTWVDRRLAFRGEKQVLSLSISMLGKIWKPDTYFFNGRESHLHTITVPNKFVRLYQDGRVLYSSRLTITANCPMDLHNFPMDTQHCPLMLGSFAYTEQDVTYKWNSARSVVISGDMKLSQFDLIKAPTNDFIFSRKQGNFSMLRASFHLQRHMGNFMIQVYGPCVLLVVLSWVSFWLNREATSDRISLGVTTVLTMTFLGLEARTDLPKVPYTTALDLFLWLSYGFIFATIIEFAFVHFFTKYGYGEVYFPQPDSSSSSEEEEKEEEEERTSDDSDALPRNRTELSFFASSISELASSSDLVSNGTLLLEGVHLPDSPPPLQAADRLRARSTASLPASRPRRAPPPRRPRPRARRRRCRPFDGSMQTQFNSVSRIDRISRGLFPSVFLLLNLIYWYSYLSHSERITLVSGT
ncbi:gamma-aminobutyric acid receptor alpha-like [Amphibalanus amphitrite]|uniref:gamma-aminobutyric acid receptor alpha-like n=1 Tax=Amphibalanus amphitrite TaxID=1232801 RepID=UPI001C910C87|nr:gamma-aminobutyric acid receptor alpha-like [Amphibalanus amphitrite]